jgi:transcriptional regulator with XRE-family HTH domain
VAANVRTLRRRLGLTQEAAAERADLDLRFLQRVEAADTNLTVAGLARLAGAFGVPISRLFRTAAMPERPNGRPRISGPRNSARKPKGGK